MHELDRACDATEGHSVQVAAREKIGKVARAVMQMIRARCPKGPGAFNVDVRAELEQIDSMSQCKGLSINDAQMNTLLHLLLSVCVYRIISK